MPTVLITPLSRWCDLDRELGELYRKAGQAYAIAIGGSQPNGAMIEDLRARLARCNEMLGRAERMEGAIEHHDDPKASVASFGSMFEAAAKPVEATAPARKTRSRKAAAG